MDVKIVMTFEIAKEVIFKSSGKISWFETVVTEKGRGY